LTQGFKCPLYDSLATKAKHGSEIDHSSQDFFHGGPIAGFSRCWPKIFSRGEKVVKFHFTHSKVRKQPFLLKV